MFDSFVNGQEMFDSDGYAGFGQEDYSPNNLNKKRYKMNKPEKQEPAPKILEGEIKRESEKAILFKFGESENWMPKSQVKINKKKNGVSIEIPAWLWDKMNQIEE